MITRLPAEELLDVIRITRFEQRAKAWPRRTPEPVREVVRRACPIRIPGLRRLPVHASAAFRQPAWRS